MPDSRSLAAIRTAFDLSVGELAELFGGIGEQVVEQWLNRGVPADRCDEVDQIAEIAGELRRMFKPQRLPAIVRGKMAGLDNRSIIDVLKTEGSEPIHELFRALDALIPGAEPISGVWER